VRQVSLGPTMTKQPRTATRPELILARGVLAVRDRPLAWIRRHPLLTDAALAAVVLAVSLPPVSDISGRDKGLSLALIIALVCPLAWRRRAPFPVFMLMTGLALAQFFVSRELNDDVALLIAFYTLAAYQPPRRVFAAAVILEAGAVLVASGVTSSLPVWAILSGLVAAAGFLGYYARTRRAYLAALVDRAERLERERDQQAQLAAAAERARIAREVHDIVAHNIAVMIALADGAAYTAAASPGQAVSLMGQVSATGRSALTEMRRLLGVLREPAAPGHAPQPTLDDVDDLLATVRSAGLPARLTVTGQPFPLPPSAQLVLYRMIQEALTNTIKHAAGATAQVRLAYRPGEVTLEVTDDGRPAAVPAAGPPKASPAAGDPAGPRGPGHGIAGMRERAAVFGGQVSAGPRPGGGWRVRTVLRFPEAPEGSGTATGTDGTGTPTATEGA
jgi:signal transduction histidine kinase